MQGRSSTGPPATPYLSYAISLQRTPEPPIPLLPADPGDHPEHRRHHRIEPAFVILQNAR
jgi:hypothetical protein